MVQQAWGIAGVLVLVAACGEVANSKPDAPIATDACVAETDAELCTAATGCEMRSLTDRCGASRTVDCGACTAGQGCVVGVCKTPVCTTFSYTTTPLTGMARAGSEDSIGAVTPDGGVIIYIPSPVNSCGGFQVMVADEIAPGSGTYNQANITSLLSGMGVTTGQDGHAITADGLTLIARTATSKSFVQLTRSARGQTDFSTPDLVPYAAIANQVTAFGANTTVTGPVISADGLQFLYSIVGANDPANNGIYSAERDAPTAAFPMGSKLPAPVTDYVLATALSSDRLALFVFFGFQGRVLTRDSTTKPFINPNAPADPPMIPGWQHKPLASCARLVAMTSPGGCLNEDVVVMQRQ